CSGKKQKILLRVKSSQIGKKGEKEKKGQNKNEEAKLRKYKMSVVCFVNTPEEEAWQPLISKYHPALLVSPENGQQKR
uniref:Uncharacterized protein n=1 Tax=Otolemur garnettii TaxID=30611 RepID=H0XPH0_OTOGA